MPDQTYNHNDVQEIMTTSPGWALKWGNTVIILVLLACLLVSLFIHYPETVQFDVSLYPSRANVFIRPGLGTIIVDTILVPDGQTVRAGAPLLRWLDSGQTVPVTYYAPLTGRVVWNEALPHVPLPAGATGPVLYIEPSDQSYLAMGAVGEEGFSRIRQGQEVQVQIRALGGRPLLKGRVLAAAPLAQGSQHQVIIQMTGQGSYVLNQTYTGLAKVTLEKQPLLLKLLGIRRGR